MTPSLPLVTRPSLLPVVEVSEYRNLRSVCVRVPQERFLIRLYLESFSVPVPGSVRVIKFVHHQGWVRE